MRVRSEPASTARAAAARTDDGRGRGPDLVRHHRHEGVLAANLLTVGGVLRRGDGGGAVDAREVAPREVVKGEEDGAHAGGEEHAGCGRGREGG